jgi:nitrogen-specific signal transduction histidine kinase
MTSVIDDEAPPAEENKELAAVPMDKLAKVYRRMATRIQELTQAYENEVEEIKRQQDTVKIALKDQMLALGVSSVRTDQGTVVLSTKTRYNTQDWDSFKTFVLQHEAVDLLEKRIAQTNMSTFLEENPGLVPPGLNAFSDFEIRVTKPTSK